jgi:hypothetical protein
MATTGKLCQPESQLDTVQQSLKPISTKPRQLGSPDPVLTDAPFQPSSQSHVAAVTSSLLRHASNDLALGKTASASTPVLEDSPYQPSSNKHVTQLARAHAGQANSNNSSKPGTPQHTPVLADSGDFQPNSRSHVAQLISQVTGRLHAQASSSSSNPVEHQQQLQDLPFQPDSKSHVLELVSTCKKTLKGPGGPAGSSSSSRPVHGCTPYNTPLARKAVGTFFTQQQQQSSHAEGMRPVPQQLDSSKPAAAAGPQIIHVSYGRAAPFTAVPGASRVAAVAHQLEGQNSTDNASTGCEGVSAACVTQHDSAISSNNSSVVPTSDVLPTAATPAVSSDGVGPRLLPPSRKPQVVAAQLSSITLEGAKVALERTASAEVTASLASDSGQNMNPLYRPLPEAVSLTETVGMQNCSAPSSSNAVRHSDCAHTCGCLEESSGAPAADETEL